jgi:hypothetical protein
MLLMAVMEPLLPLPGPELLSAMCAEKTMHQFGP